MEYLTTPLVFGTYRLNGLILEDSLNQAKYLFGQQKRPLLVDSASKYSNISTILKLMKSSSFELGWKVDWKGKKGMNSDDETSLPPTRGQYSIYQDLKGLKNMLIENNISIKRIFRILLHNYYGKNIYLLFQQAVNDIFGQDVVPIGICNISGDQLEALLVDKTVRIDYVQNEYHPFLETNVPQICSQYGVSFEAHSVMTNLEDYYPLLDKISSLSAADNHILEESSKQKPAQMAIAYAAAAMKTASNSLSICFTTNNWVHLNEVCATRPLSLPLYNAIRKFSTYIRVVKYKGANSHSNSDWVESCDEHYIRQKVLPVLVDDIKLFEKGMVPSRLCVEIPKPHRSKGKCVDVLCRLYYGLDPSDNEALKRHTQKLGVTLTKMRKVINNVEEESRRLRGGKVASCALTAVTNPSALPMGPNDYRPAEEFNDFNNFLLYGGFKEIATIEESKPNVRFHYGTINSDGRYDMCKQGFRNGFKESAEAVALDRPLTESMVVENVGGDKANIRFEHGTINSDGRYDMCKQGFRNGFKESAEAVALDRLLTESMVVENVGGDKANIRFEHGTINSDGRYDMCKQGFRNGFKESAEAVALDLPLTESMVVENVGGDKANIRFEHGTINSDGRYDMCKQGFRNGFKESAEAVALDRPLTESMVVENVSGDKANIRFEHGTINSDGRYDMCKQGFRNGFKESAEAVALDRPLTESMVVENVGGDKANIRFEHGTINSDGRYDMCKQGFRNGFKESAEAVALDLPLTESMVVENVGGDKANIRFEHGTINSDGRYDMCKQGFRNGFKESAEAVALDRPLTESMVVENVGGDKANIRFEHGTINSDGRYDMCKQGFRNGFKESAEAVALDRPLTESMVVENVGGDKANIRFEHGTVNSDGRYDMCKQGFRNGFKESAEAVALDLPLTESMVVENVGGDKANIRFEHGTINSDGRYDMCKQGFRNGFKESAEAVALDRPLTESMVVENVGGDKANIRFEHGTINSDGRYDMCKQGFRNRFKESAEAVGCDKPVIKDEVGCRRLGGRGLVKHYLIGNNRIGEDDVGSERVLALAELIKRRPDIITWYLAGNELNAESIRYIADALATTSAKYVWFKMNPVKTGAYYLARALQRNPSIELMDLFNCGICDDGLSAFLQGLTDEYSDNRTGLKHLYLSINHITDVEVLSSVLRIVGPRLESLYLGNNPIGDEGIATLLSNLMTESGSIFKNLRRLMIGSLGLTDAALSALNTFIIATPTLVALDLGSYKSTKYFQQNSNVLTDKEQLLQLGCGILRNATLQASPRLHLLGLSNACGVGQHFVDDLLDEFESAGVNVDGHQQKNNIHVVHCGRSVYGHVGEEDIKALRDPRPAIDYIQSIYRNTMKVGGL